MGQIVNNGTDSHRPNVTYHELDVPDTDVWAVLRCHLPNIPYEQATRVEGLARGRAVRIVPLVATRDIEQGEELFSSYFSIA